MKISVVKKTSVVTMSEMKLRFLTSILSLALALILSGCGDEEDAAEPEAGGTDSGETTGGTDSETAGGTGAGGTGTGESTTGGSAAVPVGVNVEKGFDVDVMHYVDQGSGFFPMSVIRAL
jgi:hypothetical protein